MLALSACASKSVDLVEKGVRPDLEAPTTLSVAAAPDQAAPVLPLVQELREAGLVAQTEAGAPYLLEVGYSERPVKVGAYSGPPPADEADGWIAPPRKPQLWPPLQRQICTLSVRITDRTQSDSPYELRASKKGRGAGCGDAAPALSSAITAKLTSP